MNYQVPRDDDNSQSKEPPTVAFKIPFTSDQMLDAFNAGALWMLKKQTGYTECDASEMAEMEAAANRYMRFINFDLPPQTVFIGSVAWKPSEYDDIFAYSGPVLVGQKSDGQLTFCVVGGTVETSESSLEYKIHDIIFDPRKA